MINIVKINMINIAMSPIDASTGDTNDPIVTIPLTTETKLKLILIKGTYFTILLLFYLLSRIYPIK